MTNSVRVEIGVDAAATCPVAGASVNADTTVTHVARSATVGTEGSVTEEFALDADDALDTDGALAGDDTVDSPAIEEVAAFDSQRVYRFRRETDRGCACELVERVGCPVSDIYARNGTLFLSFYVSDVGTVRELVGDFDERFDDVHVRQLTRADGQADRDFVFVDRSRLTGRQREVLETSFEMGYFEHPKGANAGDVAAELGIATSTFSEHLAAAQRKLLESLLR